MIASLGMYDRAETAAANDRFWALIRDGLRAAGLPAPKALTRGEGAYMPAWESPDLIFSQTCGYPFRARLHDRVTLLATPDYGLPGCGPGHYNTVLVIRADDPRDHLRDFRDARLAYNDGLSQSGWAAVQTHAAGLPREDRFVFRDLNCTGSHRGSALAVAEGRADIAGIDALTWALICRYDPFAATLRELDRTTPTPALPYIAAQGAPAAQIYPILARAVADLTEADRSTLHLNGLSRIAALAYLAVPNPPSPAQIAG